MSATASRHSDLRSPCRSPAQCSIFARKLDRDEHRGDRRRRDGFGQVRAPQHGPPARHQRHVVPPADRGRASGSLGMMNGLGAVAGLAAVTAATALFGETRTGIVVGFAAIALILAVTTVVTLLAVDEPAIPSPVRSATRLDPTVVVAAVAAVIAVVAWIAFLFIPLSALSIAAGVTCFGAGLVAGFVSARVPAIRGFFVAFRNHDFFWTFATRAFVMMGIYTIYPFLALYFRQVIRVHNPE